MKRLNLTSLAAACALLATPAAAQAIDPDDMKMQGKLDQISTHMGEMTATIDANIADLGDTLVFEPYQMASELLQRDDLVFLMRHGPTDWDKRDEKNVAPTDCANQRVMTPEGRKSMETMGTLLGANLLLPARIAVSEWCRNQQTLESLLVGFDRVAEGMSRGFTIETDPGLNLLLSLQGAADVIPLRERVTNWEPENFRGTEFKGNLLIISHFTNIEEMTNFQVFEGEILVVDPKRDNRVLGYLRLKSSSPDVGHFVQ
jgi:hypothetical protein